MAFTAMFRGIASPDHVEMLRRALSELAQASLEEPRTYQYAFYQPEDNPVEFILIASWESEADWQAHVSGEAHARFNAALPADAWAVRPVMTRLQALADTT